MKAIIFDHELKCIDTYPAPETSENEALIRVRMAGICNTDLEIIKGYKGFTGVLGHEFVGVVERIKTKDQRLLNRRVVGEIHCVCGACDYCLNGLRKHCLNRKTMGISGKDGALAEFVTLPVENLFPVPDDISDEDAVFTEPLAAAIEITRQVQIGHDDRILVMGDGKLGILTALVLKHSYKSVTLLGKHGHKLQIAENRGMQTILLKHQNVKKSFDIVVEATGSPQGIDIAIQMVKPTGTIVLKSTVAEYSRINVAPLVTDEITVIGSRCGPFEAALDTLSMKQVDVRPLISGIYTFDRAEEAFKKAREDASLKILIDFRNY